MNLLDRIASTLRGPTSHSGAGQGSILSIAAAQYGSHQGEEDLTQPTGFDPRAAALFEAVVEGAYLVVNADGEFDATERAAFEHVVLAACAGKVSEAQIRALLTDLADLREEDGSDKRVRMVARTVTRPDQAREVLRVSALLAQVSEGVSDVEREVLGKLAAEFGLDAGSVDEAVGEARRALE